MGGGESLTGSIDVLNIDAETITFELSQTFTGMTGTIDGIYEAMRCP